jgi:hypothetical protein
MKLYIVTREGVYRHEILGVYDTKEAAEKRAQWGTDHDIDNYHGYRVGECELNEDLKDDVRDRPELKKGSKWT